MDTWQTQLRIGLAQLPYPVSEKAIQQLIKFVMLLKKWSGQMNLTAIDSYQDIVSKHILDSLVVAPYFEAGENPKTVLDVGTGAGLPGIPLAIVLDRDYQWRLLDCNAKKIRFIRYVCAQLRLDQVKMIHGRLENIQVETLGIEPCAELAIICRAFAPANKILHYFNTWCCQSLNYKIFLMLGKSGILDQEKDQSLLGYEHLGSYELDVPGLSAKRHLSVLAKSVTPVEKNFG